MKTTIKQTNFGKGVNRCVYRGEQLIATIAHTDTCLTYGGKCWHLLHLTGRVDHYETLAACREDALKIGA